MLCAARRHRHACALPRPRIPRQSRLRNREPRCPRGGCDFGHRYAQHQSADHHPRPSGRERTDCRRKKRSQLWIYARCHQRQYRPVAGNRPAALCRHQTVSGQQHWQHAGEQSRCFGQTLFRKPQTDSCPLRRRKHNTGQSAQLQNGVCR